MTMLVYTLTYITKKSSKYKLFTIIFDIDKIINL